MSIGSVVGTSENKSRESQSGLETELKDSKPRLRLAIIKNTGSELNGVNVALGDNNADKSSYGVNVSGLGNVAKDSRGFNVAGFMNLTEKSIGANVAGFGNVMQSSYGFNVTGGVNLTGWSSYGFNVAGLGNFAEKSIGANVAGIINFAGESIGLDIALVNYCNASQDNKENESGILRGVQAGIANGAKILRGAQFGLYNVCGEDAEGIQIGLINRREGARWYAKFIPFLAVRRNKKQKILKTPKIESSD